MSHYPARRLRRLRASSAIRSLIRETQLSADSLIQPIFVAEDPAAAGPIDALPGVARHTVDALDQEAGRIVAAGIGAVLLFGVPSRKDATGSGASLESGVVPDAVRRIKRAQPSLVVITDVCLCSYTDHGHCGIVRDGAVRNDESVERLAAAAVSHATAGADVVAPSAMMDGQVAGIRRALDAAGHQETLILSYASKFSSAFYGPFRDAADSAPQFGDRRSYQLDGANARQAVEEARLDAAEGADLLMVKPALPYLDVIARLREAVPGLPVFAYQVSGEYSMVKAAAARGWLDERAAILETLTAIRRAGADAIITYYAVEAARILRGAAHVGA
jgi:porphobilinogen synthase